MAQFIKTRHRLNRYRRILIALQVASATFAETYFVASLIVSRDVVYLFIAFAVPVLAVLSVCSTRRQLRPDEDLLGTVRWLNARKKRYRKLYGIRVRYHSRWFPLLTFPK